MNKSVLCEQILLRLQSALANQTAAAHLARDEAVSEESRPESKYDTHGQEAAYLAEGQARLALELQANIVFYQSFVPPDFSRETPIAVGAFVELSAEHSRSWYFIGPKAGGLEILLDGHTVMVVSPQSPIGRQLLGRREGDAIPVPGQGKASVQQIIAVR